MGACALISPHCKAPLKAPREAPHFLSPTLQPHELEPLLHSTPKVRNALLSTMLSPPLSSLPIPCSLS